MLAMLLKIHEERHVEKLVAKSMSYTSDDVNKLTPEEETNIKKLTDFYTKLSRGEEVFPSFEVMEEHRKYLLDILYFLIENNNKKITTIHENDVSNVSSKLKNSNKFKDFISNNTFSNDVYKKKSKFNKTNQNYSKHSGISRESENNYENLNLMALLSDQEDNTKSSQNNKSDALSEDELSQRMGEVCYSFVLLFSTCIFIYYFIAFISS